MEAPDLRFDVQRPLRAGLLGDDVVAALLGGESLANHVAAFLEQPAHPGNHVVLLQQLHGPLDKKGHVDHLGTGVEDIGLSACLEVESMDPMGIDDGLILRVELSHPTQSLLPKG